MKPKKTGFTIVEMLTTIAIIAILVGILVPSLVTVRNMAKNAAQKAQLMTIETGLLAYRNDFGDYPESYLSPDGRYCGSQKLAEAMVGLDLMGFHPQSAWNADGRDINGNQIYSVAGNNNLYPNRDTNLEQRKGHYIELEKANAFKLGNSGSVEGLFSNCSPLAADTYVLCDVFGVRKISLGGKTVKAGTPILYYKANTSSKVLRANPPENGIYNIYDNLELVDLGKLTSNGQPGEPHSLRVNFYNFSTYGGIKDPKIQPERWPHNPDSYILISAGLDGEYGTQDDIRNFGN